MTGFTAEQAQQAARAFERRFREAERQIRAGSSTVGKSYGETRLRHRMPTHDGWRTDVAERLRDFDEPLRPQPRPSVALALLGAA